MPYNLRARNQSNRLQPLDTNPKFKAKSSQSRVDAPVEIIARKHANRHPSAIHGQSIVPFSHKDHRLLGDAASSSQCENPCKQVNSPVLLPASPSNPFTELPKEIHEFANPTEVGRGRSGVVYKIRITSSQGTQVVVVKLIDSLEDYEQ